MTTSRSDGEWTEVFTHPTPVSLKKSYIIEVDGVDYHVVPLDVARRFESLYNEKVDEAKEIAAWNEFDDREEKTDWDLYGHALDLLHKRHSKSDIARLIANILAGKPVQKLK